MCHLADPCCLILTASQEDVLTNDGPVRGRFSEVNEIPDIYLCNEVNQAVRAWVGEVNKKYVTYTCAIKSVNLSEQGLVK